jgi:hypothetical protein
MTDPRISTSGPLPDGNRAPDAPAPPPDQPALRAEYTLTLTDAAAFLRCHAKSPPRRKAHIPGWVGLIVLGLFVSVWLVVKWMVPLPFSMNPAEWALVVIVLLYLFLQLFGNRILVALAMRKARRNRRLFEPKVLQVAADGLSMSDPSGTGTTRWHAVRWIVQHPEYVFFYLTDTQAVIVPKRAFADERGFDEFVDTARSYHAEARRFVRPEGPA